MVTTDPPGCMYLWDREKIPTMRRSEVDEEWWTTRKDDFWHHRLDEERW